jgi:uncharacterized membrane protein YeaQ/YmgE (transglycosylase-associated protein family)
VSSLHRDTATAVAVAVAVLGVLAGAVAIALARSDATEGRWQHLGVIVVGSVVVQVTAQLVGTGLGMRVRVLVIAMIGTIVLPLGLWLLLGAADPVRAAQAWVTPYAGVPHLLSGQMSPTRCAHLAVVVAIWGRPDTAGAIRVRHSLRLREAGSS